MVNDDRFLTYAITVRTWSTPEMARRSIHARVRRWVIDNRASAATLAFRPTFRGCLMMGEEIYSAPPCQCDHLWNDWPNTDPPVQCCLRCGKYRLSFENSA